MSRKDKLVRRMSPGRYPRRSAATFTDENDHNPRIQQDCPRCSGSGQFCEHSIIDGHEQYALGVCTACSGTGVTGEVEPYFLDDKPEMPACADDKVWMTCPSCDWRFALRDKNAWTGRRHLRCGQKIRIVGAEPI